MTPDHPTSCQPGVTPWSACHRRWGPGHFTHNTAPPAAPPLDTPHSNQVSDRDDPPLWGARPYADRVAVSPMTVLNKAISLHGHHCSSRLGATPDCVSDLGRDAHLPKPYRLTVRVKPRPQSHVVSPRQDRTRWRKTWSARARPRSVSQGSVASIRRFDCPWGFDSEQEALRLAQPCPWSMRVRAPRAVPARSICRREMALAWPVRVFWDTGHNPRGREAGAR